jgi:DNA gyrase subunit B
VIELTQTRDFGVELDSLRDQLHDLQQLVGRFINDNTVAAPSAQSAARDSQAILTVGLAGDDSPGGIYYSGRYRGEHGGYRLEPQQRQVHELLELDGDKAAKVIAALGNKQRLDILRSVLNKPLTGPEIVEKLNMGTTGQLYHHIKALLSANLLVQEERGGLYSIPPHRTLPLLLLLAASADLLDTSDYMDLAETRNNASAYLGGDTGEYDPHHLLWAVVDNCIMEHRAGHCSEMSIFLHQDGSVSVADNGRGIPVRPIPHTEKTKIQAVLTDIRSSDGSIFLVPGGEKGINIAVVNALSERLSVEVRREGRIYRQDYKHGIPQSGLMTIGTTKETGISITFVPDRDLFPSAFDPNRLAKEAAELAEAYPELSVHLGETITR